MNRHPGGSGLTLRLLEIGGVKPCRILDMGAGDGESLRLLRSLGYDACGIDLEPGPGVEKGSFLSLPYPEGSFDAVITECSLFISGDAGRALREAKRVLRKGGTLLCSDVWFTDPVPALSDAGFGNIVTEDITSRWREYYLEQIWNGSAEPVRCRLPAGKCRYYLISCTGE